MLWPLWSLDEWLLPLQYLFCPAASVVVNGDSLPCFCCCGNHPTLGRHKYVGVVNFKIIPQYLCSRL